MQSQTYGVEEAEHQRGQIGLGRVGGGEDDAGEGDEAAGGGHALDEGAVQVAEREISAGEAAEYAAQHAGEPLHLFRADARGAERLGLLAGGAHPEAVGRLVHKEPHDEYQHPGDVDQGGVAAYDLAQEGDVLDDGISMGRM